MKQKLGIAAGLVTSATLIAFAIVLLNNDVPLNLASWIMWTVLNGLLLGSMMQAGNKEAYLAAGYTLGAGSIALMLIAKGAWHWGLVESISTLGSLLAILVWWRVGPRGAVIAATMTAVIAGIPTVYDAWLSPNPASWWLWTVTTVTGAISIATARSWTIEDRFFPVVSTAFQGLMAILVLRG